MLTVIYEITVTSKIYEIYKICKIYSYNCRSDVTDNIAVNMHKKKDYCVQFNPSEKLTGSETEFWEACLFSMPYLTHNWSGHK